MDKSAGGINTTILYKQQLSRPVAPARRDFVPLRTHWTVAGHDRYDAYRREYAAIPSAHK